MSQAPLDQLPVAFGRYRLLKLLGKGGMGKVYLAHDSQLDRPVALKIPELAGRDGTISLARFYTEARAAAAVHHPNICPTHDVGEQDGKPYLTMAYIEGRPLGDFARQRPLTPRQSAALVRKLALALSEAHKQNVIHRDLKPSNIMIDSRGEPVIMDFGLARRVQSADTRLTQQGVAMGTPAYMPPEQIQGDINAMGAASDIYSLGVILYELLTGRLPFSGSVMQLLSQVLLDEPPPPSQFCPNLEPELEAICLKAMAKRIEGRYSSMAVMAGALAGYLRAKPAIPSPLPETVSMPAPAANVETVGTGLPLQKMAPDTDPTAESEPFLKFETAPQRSAPPRLTTKPRTQVTSPAGSSYWLRGVIVVSMAGIAIFVAALLNRRASTPAGKEPVPGLSKAPTAPPDPVSAVPKPPPNPPEVAPSPEVPIEKPADKIPPKPITTAPPIVVKPQPRPIPTVKLLDEVMIKYMSLIGCSAAALAIDRDGMPWHVKGYGNRDQARTLPAGPDTLFSIATCEWPMIRASVRQLAAKGRLKLSDTILDRLRVVPAGGKIVDPRVKKITIQHVLDEKTGWDDQLVRSVKKTLVAYGVKKKARALTVEMVLSGLAAAPLKDAPGTSFHECHFCNEVLALLVARTTGRAPADFARSELLGLKAGGVAVPGSPESLPVAVWNLRKLDKICASAPALLSFMRRFSWQGTLGGEGGWHGVSPANLSIMTWRGDGIHVVALFNGRGNTTPEEVASKINKAIDTLNAALGK